MHLKEIIETLENLGIKTRIDSNGNINFFDKDINEEMNSFYIDGYLFTTEKMKPLQSIDEMLKNHRLFYIKSPMKHLSFSLSNQINGKEEDKTIILDNVKFSVKTDKGFDYYNIEFNNFTVDYSNVRVGLKSSDGKIVTFEVQDGNGINDGGYISLHSGEDFATFIMGDGLRSDLEKTEIMEIFNSNKIAQIFVNYYGNIIPGFLEIIDEFSKQMNLQHHN